MKKIKNKKGEILVENLIFIILNLVFLSILIGFIILKAGTFSLSEEKYAKEVALLVDSAKDDTTIVLNMEKLIYDARDRGYNEPLIRKLGGNTIQVKFSEKGGYSYSYFNDKKVEILESKDGKSYVININEKQKSE